METVNFLSLIPKFEALWNEGLSSRDGFSALIVLFIAFILVFFFIRVIFHFYLTKQRIFDLQSLIYGLTPEILGEKRRDLRERAQKMKIAGKLWEEFDETLIKTGADEKLYNTVNSSHFFNNSTLAPEITENRLLAAVPGFLTAIGVIGTFAGLQMGLDGITFEGDMETQRKDIQRVIAGAAVAFQTSFWGVFSSLVFNSFEKSVEQRIKKLVSNLQNSIDFLFPRISPEESLVKIADSASKSSNALDGLSERIGQELQKTVDGMSQQMSAGIKEVINPAIDRLANVSGQLADRQAQGATDALSQLVKQFLEKIAAAGESQRELMSGATQDLKASISSWQEQMSGFLTRLDAQETRNIDMERQLKGELFGNLENFTEKISSTVEEQVNASQASLTRNEKIVTDLHDLTKKLSNVMANLDSYSQRTADASIHMERAGSQIQSAALVLEREIGKTIEAVRNLSQENAAAIKNTGELLDELRELEEKLQSTATNVSATAQSASTAFAEMNGRQQSFLHELDRSLKQYESSMKDQVELLTEQVSGFLQDYAGQVEQQTNSRLDVWNRQTEEFTKQMVNTVQVLQEVISEIEDRK